MPYYEVRLRGGDRKQYDEVKTMFNGREPHHGGTAEHFYVQNQADLAGLRSNMAGVADGLDVEIKKITKREYDWKKHQ